MYLYENFKRTGIHTKPPTDEIWGAVLANRGCQLDYTCNQLKVKQLACLWRILSVGPFDLKTYPKSGPHFMLIFHTKGYGRRKCLHFACLLSLSVANPATLQWRLSLTGVRTHFFVLPYWLRTCSSLGNVWDTINRLELLRHPVSWTEQQLDSWSFYR